MEGYGRVLAYPYYGESIGSINAGLLVRRETVEKNPELVAGLVAAHARTTEWLKANPDQWLQKAAGFGTRLEVLKNAAPNMELAWNMDEAFQKRVAALGGRMKAWG